jgi:hypothetical protein
MALSNWDIMALDHEGKACSGDTSNDLGTIEIYKNWLYVTSAPMYHKGGGFVEPYIAQIMEGELSLAGFHICAWRGPQDSILVFACGATLSDKTQERESRYFCGIGCQGFSPKKNDDTYIGVQQETVDELFRRVEEEFGTYPAEGESKWLEACKKAEKLRYNQGDFFFGDVLKIGFNCTLVGEVEQPLVMKMIKG